MDPKQSNELNKIQKLCEVVNQQISGLDELVSRRDVIVAMQLAIASIFELDSVSPINKETIRTVKISDDQGKLVNEASQLRVKRPTKQSLEVCEAEENVGEVLCEQRPQPQISFDENRTDSSPKKLIPEHNIISAPSTSDQDAVDDDVAVDDEDAADESKINPDVNDTEEADIADLVPDANVPDANVPRTIDNSGTLKNILNFVFLFLVMCGATVFTAYIIYSEAKDIFKF